MRRGEASWADELAESEDGRVERERERGWSSWVLRLELPDAASRRGCGGDACVWALAGTCRRTVVLVCLSVPVKRVQGRNQCELASNIR